MMMADRPNLRGIHSMRTMTVLMMLCATVCASGGEVTANQWEQIAENAVGPQFSPGLVWSKDVGRFVLFGGRVSHSFKGERPYDVQTFDIAKKGWFNHLPEAARDRGGETGAVKDPGYKSPYFAMKDKAGLVAPNRRRMQLWYKYVVAPWDGHIYMFACGRMLRYDPRTRTWTDLKAKGGPVRPSRSAVLAWAAMCADPVNKEIVLFGGCGLSTRRAGPGTWVYSTEKNEWRKLVSDDEAVRAEVRPPAQPPVRALSPMVYDPATKKIVLFGGDRLDQLYADTWVYDCATRKWEERRPETGPSPRFGHALLYLPKSKKIVLAGGKGYTLNGRYNTTVLPFEMWTYDVAKNTWMMLAPNGKGPRQSSVAAACAAVGPEDRVLMVGAGTKRSRPRGPWNPHSTWLCQLDPTKLDAAATAKHGVPHGTVTRRTKSCDPDWYAKDLPEPDVKAQAKLLAELPPNQWVAMKYKKYPGNRNTGGWSTVTLDTGRDQILHLGGGHSSYFGNDVAIYDIKTGRWSISYAPQFALEYNGGLSGPGPYALNLAPWGNHNYHAYCYDPTSKRLVYLKFTAQLYNPDTKTWSFDEKIKAPFRIIKYTTYALSTPKGVVAWTHTAHQTCSLFRFEDGKKWVKLPLKGDKLPVTVCDGAAAVYDSKRDRLLMVTTLSRKVGVQGQVWSYDFKTGECKKLNPANMSAVKVGRFAREAVYLPKDDLMMLGYRVKIGDKVVTLFYDPAKNEWLAAGQPGSDVISGKRGGGSVGLGLVYDPKRNLTWAVLCDLRPGHVRALRFDRATAKLEVLE
jgi:galactose oxidase-like protein